MVAANVERNDDLPKDLAPTILAAGYRGTMFVSGLLDAGLRPQRVISYKQAGDRSGAFEQLADLTRLRALPFEDSRHPNLKLDRLIFVVGWQFILSEGIERSVVFHDSLLPKYRGFSPTVTALLCGDGEIGVTAFQPSPELDAGPVYGRRLVRVPADASLQSVLDLQTGAMIDLALEICDRACHGPLRAVLRDEGPVTYSLWRDRFDYFIDWRRQAAQVLRHIQCAGFPYEGAKAVLDNRVLTIVNARLGPDIAFAIREPGKLWRIDGARALVVCGAGTVWIDEAADPGGKPAQFTSLRKRFLTADNAWIAPFVTG